MKQFYLNFLITTFIGIFSVPLLSQTTLIDPAGAGGFELGASFGANGWSSSSGTNNPWVVGVPSTNNPSAPMVNNKAFISDGVTTRSYNTANPCQNYFWRDVTVPAGEVKITLSFLWDQQGEASWDLVQVFTAPTSITPVGSNTHPGSGTNNVPTAIAGATFITNTSPQTGVQTITTTLPASLAGTTFRLIFLWKSDTSAGTQPPAAIDNISLVSSLPGNYVSVATGDWTSPATWGTIDFPGGGDNVTISGGHTVTVNAANLASYNLSIVGTLAYGATPTSFQVNGDLSVAGPGIFNVFNLTTGKTLAARGNITNNGIINLSTTSSVLQLTGTSSQTISGSGTFTSNTIAGLTFNNVSTSIPNINWNIPNISVSGTLTFTAGTVSTGTNSLTLGTSTTTLGTLSYAAGGFTSGSTFGRWFAATTAGTTITAGALPGTGTGTYPFIGPQNFSRTFNINRPITTGATGGIITVQHNNGTGFNTISAVVDGSYSINRQSNANWVVGTAGGFAPGTGTFTYAVSGGNVYAAVNTNGRLMKISSVPGTNQIGTGLPSVQRLSIPAAEYTGTFYMGLNNSDLPIQTVASGNWEDNAIWEGGVAPICGQSAGILNGHTVTVNATAANCSSLGIVSGGTLNVTGNTLTVGCTLFNNSLTNNGTVNVSGGTLAVNGNINNAAGSTFTQTMGDIVVNGNNGNTAQSVLTGTPLVWFQSNNLTLTGGNLTIVTGHIGTATADRAITYVPTSLPYPLITTGHTVRFGDGVNTTANSTKGFELSTGTRFYFGNVVLNTVATANAFFASSTANVVINGDLTITNGDFRSGTTTQYIGGNIVNNGTFTNAGTLYFGQVTQANMATPTPTAVTIPQTVSGTGVFRNATTAATANYASMTINNTSASGVTFSSANSLLSGSNTGTVSGTLNFVAGVVNTGTNAFVLGISTTTLGTLSFTAGGFSSGSTFRRWFAATTAGTTIAASTIPTTGTGTYPFAVGSNSRNLHINRPSTTGATGGIISVQHNDGAGMNTISVVADGAYNINRQSNANWVVSTSGGFAPGTGTFSYAVSGQGSYNASNTNSRLMKISSVVGTNQTGTTLPHVQRTAIAAADFTGTFYLGINSADEANVSIANGNWADNTTWSKGVPPTCSDAVIILHRVTINTSGNVALGVNVGTAGRLTMQSGDLLIDACTSRADSRFDIGAGRFEMQGGTLTVRGSFRTLETPTGVFQQIGGDIIVDGNNGVVSESVTSHIADFFVTNAGMLDLTGGTFTVVDPPLSTISTNCAFKVYPYAGLNVSSGTGWQLNLGNGSVTNNGGHTSGYLINLVGLSSAAFKIGNLRINTGVGGTNRFVNTSGNLPLTTLTVTSGEYRTGSTHFISGDITVAASGTLSWTGTINFSDWNGSAGSLGSTPQQIINNGVIQNLVSGATANLTSLTLNNTGGLTLNNPLTMSGTLNMTKGILNTTATNTLRLGTITAAATISTLSTFGNDTHINGPVLRTLGSATASNTFDNTRLYPTGKGGVYYPIWLSPTTTAPTIFTAEAFTDMPGTPGPGVSNLADNRWVISADVPANITAAHVQLGDADIVSSRQILQAPTANGAYSGIVTGTSFTAGTPNTIKTNPNGSPIPSANYTGFFSYGDLVPCLAPSAQPTSLMFSGVSSTSLIGMFSLATPAADGYLVVRYPSGATPVNPLDGTSYSPGGTLGTGTIAAVGAATTFNVTGLVASTTYDFYVYSYNAIGCGGGPVYLTSSPLFGIVTTCSTVVNPISGLATSARTQTTFNIFWTASTTPNVSYWVDVASDVNFTNILQFNLSAGTGTTFQITGLLPSTTYHFRVRALDPVSGCFSTNVAAQNGTNCSATNTPYLENLNGSLACLSIFSTGTGNSWGIAAAPAAPSGMTGNTARIISSTSAATNNYFVTRAINLTGGQSYDFKFKYGNSTGSATLSMDMIYSQADVNGGIVLANNVVMGTLNNINNTVTNTIAFSFTPPTTGEYYLMLRAFGPIASSATNLHVDDIEVFLTPPCALASGGTASSTITGSICGNPNTTSLTATGYTYASGMTYQWEKSTDNMTWTNMGSVITHPAQPITPVVSDPFTVGNNYYRLRAVCANGPVTGYSSVIGPIVYTNPQPLTTTGGTRCGTGTVDLSATVNPGDGVRWYANPTGGLPIGTNLTFTTPSISTTTNFYVANVTNPVNLSGLGNTTIPTSTGALNERGIVFTANGPMTIVAADYYSTTTNVTNTVTVKLVDNSTGSQVGSNLVLTIPQGAAASWYTMTLNLNVPAAGSYRLLAGFSQAVSRHTTGVDYTLPAFNNLGSFGLITSGFDGSVTSTSYNYFHNINASSGCEGTRVPVTATVTSPPALTLSSAAETICEASSTPTISITSNISDYDTYTWSPSTNVSGTPATGYVFNPTTTTTYTLNASQINPPLCATSAQIVVTVNPRPNISSVTATPATVNCGQNSQLDVSVLSTISTYSFANNTSPFSLLSGATPVTATNASNDDGISAALPIGFNFNFGGSSFSQFLMSTNGWITFDLTATTATTNYSSLSGTVNHIIAAYSGDLTSTGSAMSYQTTGSPGSQICKIEWTNTTEWSTTEVPDLSSFQIWLYEGTNVVEIRYGSFGVGTRTVAQSPLPQVGLRGTSTGVEQVLSLGSTTNWAAPVAGNVSTTGMPATVAVLPDNGRMYTFTPKTFSYTWAPTTYLNNPNIRNPIAQNIGGSITYNAIVTDVATGCVRTSSDVQITTTTNCSIGLALTAFIEGYFDGGTMVPVLLNSGVAGATASQADTIVVALHNNTAPYAKAYEFKGVLGTNGTLNCTFPGAANGGNYYIVVTGRNMLETWSASSMVFTATNTYNFSTDASQAFGGNMVNVGETWCFYSGDIDGTPADGNIDLIDYPIWETDYNNLEVGYFRSDLNGDGSVDLVDYPLWETNYNNLITVIKP